ncbi:heme-binding protein [Mycobacterium sp. NPDC050853]|uniref:heme-binding protein n=1 Tax=Mycobacterium sp. NPDC050853 TaxID=3155160 RepID=UPI0033F959E8
MKLIATSLFTALGAAALFTAVAASAEPERPANCTAADLAGVSAGVAASTSSYLFTHPDVNEFFTGLQGRPHPEVQSTVKSYMDANPETAADLRGIRQPLVDLRDRCQLPAAPQVQP